jgi:hypothetical protein
LPCRNAELNSGSVVTLRPRIGVSSIVLLSSCTPICASARTPLSVPMTVTSVFSVPTSSLTLTVAVSPERRLRPPRDSSPNPCFETTTEYVPVSDSAGNDALPSGPEKPSRVAPVCSLVTRTFASLTTAPDWSVTSTTIDALFGDCPAAGAAMIPRMANSNKTFFMRSYLGLTT